MPRLWGPDSSRPVRRPSRSIPARPEQMYTGEADHALTRELVERVTVPVIASGDVTSRARAQAILATTGCAAVMVGRAAQGNPWALREIMAGDSTEPTREEVAAELFSSCGRPCASSVSAAPAAS